MGDLQVTLEIVLELHRFFNVDLFQRGFYQIRSSLRVPSKIPSKVEVSLPKNSSCALAFPACVVNGTAVSKTFQILYKNEEVQLDDTVSFKTHLLLEGYRVRDILLKADFQLLLELWFTDQNFGPDHHSSIQCVSTRLLQLHFDPCRGMHHHRPVLFDYFHLSAITLTIHATLLALCQPYLSLQRLLKSPFASGSPRMSSKKVHLSSLELLLFGPQHSGRSLPSSGRLHRGKLVHWELCSLLLAAHASLQRKLVEYMKLLPAWQQLKMESAECLSSLDGLSELAKVIVKQIQGNNLMPSPREHVSTQYQGFQSEEEILVSTNSDIAQLCGALVVLWQQFLEVVLDREKVREHLARQHHQQRAKRFAEAFFLIEKPRHAAMHPSETSVQVYQEVTEELRRSNYLNLLPPLELECEDLDGDFATLPIVYEEHYQETARRNSSSLSRSSQSTVSLHDIQLLMEEPNHPVRNALANNSEVTCTELQNYSFDLAKCSSPSASSLSDNVFSPITTKPPSNKISLKEKFLNSLKLDMDYEREEYNLSTSSVSKKHHKVMRSKIKIRSRTANLLRQFRRVASSSSNSSVVLMGFKRMESMKMSVSCQERLSKAGSIKMGMRHSLSTLSVVGSMSLAERRRFGLHSSESMPDLSSVMLPPPPPPPRQRFASTEFRPHYHMINGNQTSFSCFEFPLMNSSRNRSRSEGCEVGVLSTKPLRSKCDKLRVTCDMRAASENAVNGCSKESEKDPVTNHVYEEICPPSPPVQFRDPQPNAQGQVGLKENPPTTESSATNEKQPVTDKKFDSSTAVTPSSVVTSTGVTSTGVTSTGVTSKGVTSKGVTSTGVTSTAVTSTMVTSTPVISTAPTATTTTAPKNGRPTSHDFDEVHCEGTMFFPKPPPEFTESKKTENGTSEIEEPEKSNVVNTPTKKPVVTEPPKPAEKAPEIEVIRRHRLEGVKHKQVRRLSYFERKCTILEMLTDMSDPEDYYRPVYCNGSPPEQFKHGGVDGPQKQYQHLRSQSLANCALSDDDAPSLRRISVVGSEMISFVKAKEDFRQHLGYPWLWYSDFPSLASSIPYFQCDSDLRAFSPDGLHLVICVHGLDGNSADLRLVRTYLELGLPMVNFEFLMSERNQGETFDDFETMTDRLVSEITFHVEGYGLNPARISFIGHSLGNIIIRSALARAEMKPFLGLLHTFLSLSGPHLGTLYNSSGLVNMGMWFMQKWKKSGSLLQLSMKDAIDPRQTFLYKLSKKPGIEYFRNVLLFGSSQDRYVPIHSARMELCKASLKDNSVQGACYREMVANLLQPILKRPEVQLMRYDVHHALPSSANSLIGRAAHIAVLDSELFIEKFMVVCGLKYFA